MLLDLFGGDDWQMNDKCVEGREVLGPGGVRA